MRAVQNVSEVAAWVMELYIFIWTEQCIHENLWNVFGIIKGWDKRCFPGVLLGEFGAYRSVSSHGIIPPQRRPQWGRMWLFHAWEGNAGQGPERLQPPAPPPPKSTHNFSTWLYVFSRRFRFLTREQSCYGDVLSLVAMGTGTDEDVSQFSGCLRLRTRACEPADASEWTYTASVSARVRVEGSALCKCRTCARGAESAGAFPALEGPWVKLYGERSGRLREQIGPEDTLTTQLLLFWCIWRRGRELALISQRIS